MNSLLAFFIALAICALVLYIAISAFVFILLSVSKALRTRQIWGKVAVALGLGFGKKIVVDKAYLMKIEAFTQISRRCLLFYDERRGNPDLAIATIEQFRLSLFEFSRNYASPSELEKATIDEYLEAMRGGRQGRS